MRKNKSLPGGLVVTGGAGYIGGLCLKRLLETFPGTQIIVIDNLSKGRRETLKIVDSLKLGPKIEFIQADVGQPEKYAHVFKKRKILAVLHFAGFLEVEESVKYPQKFMDNNARKPEKLLKVMIQNGVRNIIFSSTASVYGIPKYLPIDEKHPTKPINPYGQSKLAFEKKLAEYHKISGLNFIAFRYFNAAGADPAGILGEAHSPETHLIPNILLNALKKKPVKVFGRDYSTADGTCIRDYIHVTDLVDAHLRGLKFLLNGKVSGANYINLGSNRGFSILEVINTSEKITGQKIKIRFERRRPGDGPALVASHRLAKKILGWGTGLKNLETIISSAWRWHRERK